MKFTRQAKQIPALACARAPEFLERTCRASARVIIASTPIVAVQGVEALDCNELAAQNAGALGRIGGSTVRLSSEHFRQLLKMKKFLKHYKHLTALLAVIILAVSLFCLGAPLVSCVATIALWQLSQFAMSRQRGYCYTTTALTPGQMEEIGRVMEKAAESLPKIFDRLDCVEHRMDDLNGDLRKWRRSGLAGAQTGVRWIGGLPYVSDDCAAALTSSLVLQANSLGAAALKQICRSGESERNIIAQARAMLGLPAETRAGGALTPTDIPLPTIYAPQIIELVFAYGQARKFGTVFPLGAGTVKLPRLQVGEDQFAYLGAGTAGISQAVPQKEVTAVLVTFTANKLGGLIRIPFELEEDTFVPIGQFLARYVARQFALQEDKTLFLADGTGTYANITGIAKYCQTNTGYLQVLPATKTATSQATLADFRNMRALVNPAVLANMAANGGQTQGAYYMHPSFEPLLRSFNQYPNFVVFNNENGKPTFDGWPVRWIGVSAVNSATATIDTPFAFFGDLSYWYLGERGTPRVEVSKEVFFATDELAMRALERIDVEAMAVDAMATLQTAHA